MDIINYMKRTANKNTIWIDTTDTGAALADHFEAQGVLINRFTCLDQQTLKQHLDCDQRET